MVGVGEQVLLPQAGLQAAVEGTEAGGRIVVEQIEHGLPLATLSGDAVSPLR